MVSQILMNKTVKKGRNNITTEIANKIYCAYERFGSSS